MEIQEIYEILCVRVYVTEEEIQDLGLRGGVRDILDSCGSLGDENIRTCPGEYIDIQLHTRETANLTVTAAR